jgi:transposase
MRGHNIQQSTMFSYLSPEQRVPTDHPLRRIRPMVDIALKSLSPAFDEMYSALGRPSIAPEKLLKALLLQVLYTIRSERLLMEQLSYNLLFRWFVGLNMDEAVWVPTVYSKNRDRLEAKLAYCGNVIIENRNGLVVDTELLQCNGTAERDAAMLMAERLEGTQRVTLGADKGYDTKDFVKEMRGMNVTPHVSQNHKRPGGSAIDGRTTRHAGYQISEHKRKRIEEVFGWLKTVGMLRKTRHRGVFKVGWVFTFAAAAYNLVRMRNLLSQTVQSA